MFRFKNINILTIMIAVTLLFVSQEVIAQSVRSLVNDGVDLYKAGKYSDAEVKFKKAEEKDAENFHSYFNLGDALYKQGRYDDAIKAYQNSLALTKDDLLKAKIYHNVGNALLKKKKLKESIGSYIQSLKLNPKDLETKYNLSYALKQMKQNKKNRHKKFYVIGTHAICKNMKKTHIENLRDALKFEQYEIKLNEDIVRKARQPIEKMVSIKRG